MTIMWYLVKTTLYVAVDILILMMLVHAIMSWIRPAGNNRLLMFIDNVVDGVVSPVRRLLERFEFARSFPIDLSFLATWFLLMIIQRFIVSL